MTNRDKFKTPERQSGEFVEWYWENHDGRNDWSLCDAFKWLDLEAETKKPLPCPFCGSTTSVVERPDNGACWVCCENGECKYTSSYADSEDDAIAAHNRVARAVAKAAGESEVAK